MIFFSFSPSRTRATRPRTVSLTQSTSEHGIALVRISIPANKEPFGCVSQDSVRRCLRVMRDTSNHPILVQDDKGKHRTGLIVGCYRKALGWSLSPVFHEYERFTKGSVRLLDFLFIEEFSRGGRRRRGTRK